GARRRLVFNSDRISPTAMFRIGKLFERGVHIWFALESLHAICSRYQSDLQNWSARAKWALLKSTLGSDSQTRIGERAEFTFGKRNSAIHTDPQDLIITLFDPTKRVNPRREGRSLSRLNPDFPAPGKTGH